MKASDNKAKKVVIKRGVLGVSPGKISNIVITKKGIIFVSTSPK